MFLSRMKRVPLSAAGWLQCETARASIFCALGEVSSEAVIICDLCEEHKRRPFCINFNISQNQMWVVTENNTLCLF